MSSERGMQAACFVAGAAAINAGSPAGTACLQAAASAVTLGATHRLVAGRRGIAPYMIKNFANGAVASLLPTLLYNKNTKAWLTTFATLGCICGIAARKLYELIEALARQDNNQAADNIHAFIEEHLPNTATEHLAGCAANIAGIFAPTIIKGIMRSLHPGAAA